MLHDDLKLITPVEAIEAETGNRPHYQTCNRWMLKGRKGVRLQFRQVGRSKLTCRQWVRDFLDATTAIELPPDVGPSPAQRRREIATATAQLDDLLA